MNGHVEEWRGRTIGHDRTTEGNLNTGVGQGVVGESYRYQELASPIMERIRLISRGNKYQLMAKSRLRDGTEPAVFVPEVTKQHDVFAVAIQSRSQSPRYPCPQAERVTRTSGIE